MIRLIVDPSTQPTVYSFDKHIVIIGAEGCPNVDLTLSHENLEPVHVKIEEDSGKHLIINQANDPFVTLNGLPFGKKYLRSHDIIEVGSTKILFESVPTPREGASILDTEIELPGLVEKMILQRGKEAAQQTTTANFSLGEKEEAFDLEMEMRVLDAWLRDILQQKTEENQRDESTGEPYPEVELLSEGSPEPLPPAQEQAPSVENPASFSAQKVKPKQTIKDLYFNDADEETSSNFKSHFSHSSQPEKNAPIDWHTLWIIVLGIVSTIAILALLLYANASGKSETEELRAAEGIADVAMALTHAQFYTIIPQNQNWSDPDFIKKNLTAILDSEHRSLASLDSHGQFTNCPYLMRIYTSSDLSNFLIIAQPAPSVFQWLIPKSTVMIYSKEMLLRKTTDLKSLNRVLVNPSLDGNVAEEVANIVKKADLIPLAALFKRQKNNGFSPPNALALLRPGAENKVYNAPRYYNFGESIMKKATLLAGNQENNNEIALVKHEIAALNRYPDLVMYSAQGMQAATQAQKSIALFEPLAKFLIAYLQFDTQGIIYNSHLLIDDGSSEASKRRDSQIADANESQPQIFNEGLKSFDASLEEITHPLYFQLSALAANRQQILKPLGQNIASLLEHESLYALNDFEEQFQELSSAYLKAVNEQQLRAGAAISRLYREYSSIPLSEFMQYVKSTGLESLTKMSLQEHEKNDAEENSDRIIAEQIQKIEECCGLAELEREIANTNNLLNFQQIPDPDKIIALQNMMRKKSMNTLDSLLFSYEKHLPFAEITEENFNCLKRILKSSWIREEEEIAYYTNEFNILLTRKTAGELLIEKPSGINTKVQNLESAAVCFP